MSEARLLLRLVGSHFHIRYVDEAQDNLLIDAFRASTTTTVIMGSSRLTGTVSVEVSVPESRWVILGWRHSTDNISGKLVQIQ